MDRAGAKPPSNLSRSKSDKSTAVIAYRKTERIYLILQPNRNLLRVGMPQCICDCLLPNAHKVMYASGRQWHFFPFNMKAGFYPVPNGHCRQRLCQRMGEHARGLIISSKIPDDPSGFGLAVIHHAAGQLK